MTNSFDKNVLNTISTGSSNIIALISPLMATCFSIYVLLILWTYWQGRNDEPINDFLMRMATWALILTCGMNIQFYSEYVVPFFNGFGEQMAGALTNGSNPVSGLDNLLNAYINAAQAIYAQASGLKVIAAIWTIALMIIFGGPFMAIAIAYIILAKFALGLLLALGPLFISAALFPPSRQFFWNWVGQCMNYTLLVALFAAACALEVNFAMGVVPLNGSPSIAQVIDLDIMGLAFWVISLNLPGLASSLAGGVGISTMVGNLGSVARFAGSLGKMGGGGSPKTGGSLSEA
ncbi:conjugal transfer protein TrbL [Paraburkholderia madseniana]|uniref:Conjugal transfer protein TrbL n=1 Tax=Paraburkholderia madseniana TaxID=2599607 RepID=A0A6N6W8K0_9BURK|nr:type IV secretion system protein [Paraburkholderia madseniana]KAE8756756.1 conjugal transfer protein TrbL [Paraburkholderia madseniana]